MRKLHNKVIQLSSYHSTNKEVHYVHTADNWDDILPRGGPIRDPFSPLLEVVFPQSYTVKSYTVKRLRSEKVIQLHSYHAANKKKGTLCPGN